MTKEQEKAIELNKILVIEKYTKNIGTQVYISDLETVLNLLSQLEKEKQEWKKAYYEIKEKTSGIPNTINR